MISLKVSSKSVPGKLAGAIAGNIKEGNWDLRLECIGAGAVNAAVKAIATARGFVAASGRDILVKPFFSDIMIDGEEKTAINMTLIVTEG